METIQKKDANEAAAELAVDEVGAQSCLPFTPAPVSPDRLDCRPACFSNTWKECLFVFTITYAVSANQVSGGIFLCITNYIGNELRMTAAEVTWINSAQSLTGGAFLLLFGQMSDLYGRRKLLLTAMFASTACLIAIGFVNNAILMLVLLGLLGLISAASVPPAMGFLGAVYKHPSKRRNRAFTFCSAGTPVGSGLGVVLGGLTLHLSNWRTSVWLLAVLTGCSSVLLWWTVPDDHQIADAHKQATFKDFDLMGSLLAATGLTLVTAPMTLANEAPHGWKTPYIIAMLVLGMATCSGFVLLQTRQASPLIPPAIWRDKSFTFLVLILTFCFFGFVGNTVWLTLSWQRIDHSPPLEVAARLMPAVISAVITEVVLALTMHRINYRFLVMVGALAFLLSNILLSLNSATMSWWALTFPALISMTMGAEILFTLTISYSMSIMDSKHQSMAGSLLFTLSRFATTLGLGAQTAIFTGQGGSSFGSGSVNHRAYQATAWMSLGASFVGLVLVPFVRLGKQELIGTGIDNDEEKRRGAVACNV